MPRQLKRRTACLDLHNIPRREGSHQRMGKIRCRIGERSGAIQIKP